MKRMMPLLMFLIISCGRTNNNSQDTELQINEIIESIVEEQTLEPISEEQKIKMYCAALENFSTAPNYVVVTVKNLNTGEIREICTEAPFLEGAITRQTGKDTYTIDSISYVLRSTVCDDYPNRYFEFSKDSALWNISFDLYTISELEEYAKTINVEKIVQKVKEGKLQEKTFGIDKKQTWQATRKEQIMFAHLMFNNGIMMTRGCIAGNVCGLRVYEEITNNKE